MKKYALLILLMMASALHAQFNAVDALSNLFQSEYTIVERSNDGNIKSVRYAATEKSHGDRHAVKCKIKNRN